MPFPPFESVSKFIVEIFDFIREIIPIPYDLLILATLVLLFSPFLFIVIFSSCKNAWQNRANIHANIPLLKSLQESCSDRKTYLRELKTHARELSTLQKRNRATFGLFEAIAFFGAHLLTILGMVSFCALLNLVFLTCDLSFFYSLLLALLALLVFAIANKLNPAKRILGRRTVAEVKKVAQRHLERVFGKFARIYPRILVLCLLLLAVLIYVAIPALLFFENDPVSVSFTVVIPLSFSFLFLSLSIAYLLIDLVFLFFFSN